MKVKDLIDQSKLHDDRIKLLEDEIKAMKEERKKQDEDEVSPYELEAKFKAFEEVPFEMLKKRVDEIEKIHPTENDLWPYHGKDVLAKAEEVLKYHGRMRKSLYNEEDKK
ncbi:hypothetical protein ES703_19057 [subsurface metagenome]